MPSPPAPAFQRFLLERYPVFASQDTAIGRRKTRLRVLDAFFSLDPASRASFATTAPPSEDEVVAAPSTRDGDPVDALLSDTPGVVVRTDFSDDTAWSAFLSALREGEKEILEAEAEADGDGNAGGDGGSDSDPSSEAEQEQEQVPAQTGTGALATSAVAEASASLAFFSVVDPSSAEDRAALTGACNIAVMRLFADADVRAAPAVPQGQKRVKPGHRLVDSGGFQEIYRGRTVWIYDAVSNADGAVRMVNLEGDVYGTATGDSWRVRASHITEMQVNMTFHGMKVGFGGIDGWDYRERVRNLDFANLPQT